MGGTQSDTGRDGLAPGINSAAPYDSDAEYEDAQQEIVEDTSSGSVGVRRPAETMVATGVMVFNYWTSFDV